MKRILAKRMLAVLAGALVWGSACGFRAGGSARSGGCGSGG